MRLPRNPAEMLLSLKREVSLLMTFLTMFVWWILIPMEFRELRHWKDFCAESAPAITM